LQDLVNRTIAHRFRIWNRTRKARVVDAIMTDTRARSVLFVGVGGGWDEESSIVERAAARRAARVVACDLYPAVDLPWTYVRCDGTALPFKAGAFDLVLSNAVIEHVGDEAAQRRFVAEHLRVARHRIVTTPNRWFPVESHTCAAFRHWSPGWRASHAERFTRLLSGRELRQLLPGGAHVRGRWWSPTFTAKF
jgi:2-polyprenyl-3-methyl-5-hydroxy-6-metoxy-1,4-benzoquinol methylase